jgi:hypothetical protein
MSIYLYNHILFHSAQIPNWKGQIHPAAPSPGRLAAAGTLGALHELRNDGRKEDQDGATHQHLRTFLRESVIQPWGEAWIESVWDVMSILGIVFNTGTWRRSGDEQGYLCEVSLSGGAHVQLGCMEEGSPWWILMIFTNCRAHPNVVIGLKIQEKSVEGDAHHSIFRHRVGSGVQAIGCASAMWKFLQDYVVIVEPCTRDQLKICKPQLRFMLSGLTDWGIWASRS